MIINPYHCPDRVFYAVTTVRSYVRILHAAPNVKPVDVYANNKQIAKNVSYKTFTQYFALSPAKYTIKVYPTGTTANAIIDTQIDLAANSIFTLSIIGQHPNHALLPVPEPLTKPKPGKVLIRFVHLSPNTPNVDITLPDGNRLFKDVEYKEITDYIEVDPKTYTLQARTAGTETIILNVPNITLRPNRIYTIYAVGLSGEKPGLQVLIPMDGSTYLKF